MPFAIVEVPFQEDLLTEVDNIVGEKYKTRSEVILAATRLYINRKHNWQKIFALGDKLAIENNLSETDVVSEIKAWRSEKDYF
jgi:metal-responsive CopG/Arc/MetJ family transcriptional regulator